MNDNEKVAEKPQIKYKELEKLQTKLAIEETKLKIMQMKAQQSALKTAMNESVKTPEPLAQEEF